MPKAVTDLTGRTYGRLTVRKLSPRKTASGKYQWLCICTCGSTSTVRGGDLTSGHTKSCGCLSDETRPLGPVTHGHSANGRRTSEYVAWQAMHQRCSDVKNPNYGGRGIQVCKRWSGERGFERFLSDMGPKPSPKRAYSLERINNSKGYSPSNTRWATKLDQNNNRRNNLLVAYKGSSRTLMEWSKLLGISYRALHSRYHKGDRGSKLFRPSSRNSKGESWKVT